MPYTPDSLLTGYQPIAAGWQGALTAHGALPDAVTIIAAYQSSCLKLHLDPNLALAQACHESAWFTSTRWTQENNSAGLGIVADNTPPNPFKTPQEGIQAHCEHLCCYTHLIGDCPADHAHLADRRHFFHDGLPKVSDLERLPARGWANPGTGYVDSLVTIANSIGGTAMSAVPTEADLGYPGKVHYATGSGEAMDLAAVQWFIVHDTEGGFAGSEAALAGQISAHLLIDKTGEWRFMVPLTTVAYSAGNLPVNRASIAVEHVGYVDAHDGGYTDAQYRCCAAFFRFCVANGMVNVPAVYIGKQDADGGPEPDVAGILGHQDVPRDDGQPGWGGDYGHTDPGPTYDWPKLTSLIQHGTVQPPPPPAPDVLHINGHVIGGAFKALWESTPRSYQAFGNPLSEEVTAQVTDVSADGVDAHSVTRTRTVQFFDRCIFIYQPEQPADWQAVAALTTQLIDPVSAPSTLDDNA